MTHEIFILSWDELISRWRMSVTRYQSISFPLAVKFKFCGSLDFASGAGIRWY